MENGTKTEVTTEVDTVEVVGVQNSHDQGEQDGTHTELDEYGEPPLSLVDEIKDIASTVGIALVFVLILRTFLFQPYTIPSASMEPNLYEGDYIIVSKWNYGFSKHSILLSPPLFKGRIFESQAKAGDIIVFKLPSDNKTDFIKRVIGVPGDRVQVRNNQLYVNEAKVETRNLDIKPDVIVDPDQSPIIQEETLAGGKPHKIQDLMPTSTGDETDVFTVPEGYYFVMGDNRDNSLDSRFSADDLNQPGVGLVPAENLEGKANIILLSWNPGSSLWKPWTWLNLRWDRFFKPLS